MNKKILISILLILLLGWITGCAYWYAFKSKKSNEIGLLNNYYLNDYDYSVDFKSEITAMKKSLFSMSNEDLVGTEFNQLATYLKKNPAKILKIIGLYSNTNDSDSLGKTRAISMANYLETNSGISIDRIIIYTNATEDLDIETNGSLEYEIVSKIEPVVIEEVNKVINKAIIKSDPNLKRKVKGSQVMYYPLTQFEIDPTYALEKYFEILKKYFDQNPEGLVQITGHTAKKEDESLSRYHSRKYAEKVKKYLIAEYEMNPRNFRIKGRGDSRPVAISDTDIGRAKNSRIEFSFIK